MQLKILGCYGGEAIGCNSPAFLLDNNIALDAGGLSSTLSLDQQLQIDHIFITHAHMDHIKDLTLLADNVVDKRKRSVEVYASIETIKNLKTHLFNNCIWPDFSAIPSLSNPAIRFNQINPLVSLNINGYEIFSVPVNHPINAVGFIMQSASGSLAYSGDTGPTDLFWQEINQLKDLKAIIVETSFPDRFEELAEVSGHLTPRSLQRELNKILCRDIPIMIFHQKPAFIDEIKKEIAKIKKWNIIVLEQSTTYDL